MNVAARGQPRWWIPPKPRINCRRRASHSSASADHAAQWRRAFASQRPVGVWHCFCKLLEQSTTPAGVQAWLEPGDAERLVYLVVGSAWTHPVAKWYKAGMALETARLAQHEWGATVFESLLRVAADVQGSAVERVLETMQQTHVAPSHPHLQHIVRAYAGSGQFALAEAVLERLREIVGQAYARGQRPGRRRADELLFLGSALHGAAAFAARHAVRADRLGNPNPLASVSGAVERLVRAHDADPVGGTASAFVLQRLVSLGVLTGDRDGATAALDTLRRGLYIDSRSRPPSRAAAEALCEWASAELLCDPLEPGAQRALETLGALRFGGARVDGIRALAAARCGDFLPLRSVLKAEHAGYSKTLREALAVAVPAASYATPEELGARLGAVVGPRLAAGAGAERRLWHLLVAGHAYVRDEAGAARLRRWCEARGWVSASPNGWWERDSGGLYSHVRSQVQRSALWGSVAIPAGLFDAGSSAVEAEAEADVGAGL